MEYFLQIENSQYYHWQTELLIESFKRLNREDDLFISISASAQNVNSKFLDNIKSHKNKEYIIDYGEEKGYKNINKIINLANSLINEKVKQPLCVIEPDAILKNQPLVPEINSLYPSFIFSVDPSFTIDKAKEKIGDFFKYLELKEEDFESNWIPLGGFYIINNFFPQIFYNSILDAETLVVHQMLDNKEVWDETYKLAFVLNIIKNIPYLMCRGDYQISSSIDSDVDSFFISYKHGYLPVFHKSMFTFKPPMDLSFGDPIKSLSQLTFSPNSQYVAKVARSIVER